MKDAKDLIPWKVTDISIRPYEDLWSFNPSINFDGELWRCVLRCCDYAMPDSVTIRSKNARSIGQQTKNAMAIFDPQSWRPVKIYKMHEKDDLPRASTPHVGYEDMRLFKTDKGGLQGIAASLHLQREPRSLDGRPQHQPPEQVVLSFDENYDIVAANPIRGDKWSGAQKNWVPFHDCVEPRFLYAIDQGRMFDEHGPVHGDAAIVSPSLHSRPLNVPIVYREPLSSPIEAALQIDHERQEHERQEIEARNARSKQSSRKTTIRGSGVRIARGGRIKLDTMTSRPSSRPSSRSSSARTVSRSTDDSTRMMGSGRMLLPKYDGLRGGTQLIRVGDDAWLGVGHSMTFSSGKKYYWHVFYLTDSRGKLTATSEPVKLAPEGIEFAAGMAIDGDRVVISFGVDDMNARIGETKLSAVMEILRPIAR
jgi:predicted GH43/DUF377 family glycosyl hydrolase